MHEVLVNCLGGLSLPKKSVVRLTDRPDMTLDVYRGRKTMQQQQQQFNSVCTDGHAESSLNGRFSMCIRANRVGSLLFTFKHAFV